MNSKNRAIFYTVLSVSAWSFIPLVSKMAQNKIDGSLYLLYSNVLSFVAVLSYCLISSKPIALNKKLFLKSSYLGFLGAFFFYICIYFGYKHSNAVTVLIIQYLWPILTVLLSSFILKEKMSIKKYLAVILGFSSVIIVITKGNLSQIAYYFSHLGFISIVVFAGAFAFALFSTLSKKDKTDPYTGVVLIFFWGALFSFVWSILKAPVQTDIDINDILFITINGVFINGISYIWWIKALSLWEASKISVFVYLTPILGTLWLFIFSNQKIYPSYIISLLLISVAGILTLKKEN